MSRRVLVLCVLGVLALPAVAGAQEVPAPVPGERFIGVSGAASARVQAPARRTNATIARAVRRASLAALPRAIAAARQRAEVVARATGLRLGEVRSVDETRFGPFFDGFGRYGPGQYCATRTRRIFARRRPGEARPRVIRTVRERRCDVPPRTSTVVAVTFAVI